jgi:pyrroloquinoline quinone biosynthesis protein D
MTQTITITRDSIPRLPHGVRLKHDDLRGEWLLLAPERIIKTNPPAVEILKRCDGAASIGAIADDIAQSFSAPREQVEADVIKLISDLASRRLLDV